MLGFGNLRALKAGWALHPPRTLQTNVDFLDFRLASRSHGIVARSVPGGKKSRTFLDTMLSIDL